MVNLTRPTPFGFRVGLDRSRYSSMVKSVVLQVSTPNLYSGPSRHRETGTAGSVTETEFDQRRTSRLPSVVGILLWKKKTGHPSLYRTLWSKEST